MIDFKNEKKALLAAIRGSVEPIVRPRGFKWQSANLWTKDVSWALLRISLGVRKLSHGLYCDLVGGAGMFLKEYHPILQPDYLDFSATGIPPSSIGGPLHWIDERIGFSDGNFTSLDEFQSRLPKFTRAIEERVFAEFDRYSSEEELLAAMLSLDPSKGIKFSVEQDRRAGLVALMLAKRDGAPAALDWIQIEYERLKKSDVQKRPLKYWRQLYKASKYLEASLGDNSGSPAGA